MGIPYQDYEEIHRRLKKMKDGWHVYSKRGKHLGGPFKTKKAAEDRLRQIEMFKNLKERGRSNG